MQTEQARLVAEAQRESESRVKNASATLDNELTAKDGEIKKIQQEFDSLKTKHDRQLEESIQSLNLAQKHESRIKSLEIQLKDTKDDLDESHA